MSVQIEESGRLWTIKDVAAFLNVKESAIRCWIFERRIRFHKVGVLIRFIPGEISDDVRANKIGQVTENEYTKPMGSTRGRGQS